MTKWFWTIASFAHGVFFLSNGIAAGYDVQSIFGSILLAISTLVVIDELRERREAATQVASNVGLAVSQKVNALALLTQNRVTSTYHHMSAIAQVIKNAPAILEQQRKMQQLFEQLEMQEAARADSSANTNSKFEVSRAEAIHQQNKANRVIDPKMAFVNYAANDRRGFWQLFKESQVQSQFSSGNNLVVSDIGDSDVTEVILQDYLDENIDIGFWIAKGVAGNGDLLIIPKNLVANQPGLVWATARKISGEYAKIVWFVNDEIQNVISQAFDNPEVVILELPQRDYSTNQSRK